MKRTKKLNSPILVPVGLSSRNNINRIKNINNFNRENVSNNYSSKNSSQKKNKIKILKHSEKFNTIGEHLEDFRKHLIWIIFFIIFFCSITLIFSNQLHNFLITPYTKLTNQKLLLQNVYGGLEVLVKIGINVGLILVLPIILSIIWHFVSPAFSKKTLIIGNISVAFTTLLFWFGIIFAWIYLLPISLSFLFQDFMLQGVSPQTTVEKYYSFIFLLFLGCGLVFQLPLLTIALGWVGIVTLEWHKKYWRYIIVGTLIFAAIVTPPEPISQLVLSSVLLFLYLIAVIVVWSIEKVIRKN